MPVPASVLVLVLVLGLGLVPELELELGKAQATLHRRQWDVEMLPLQHRQGQPLVESRMWLAWVPQELTCELSLQAPCRPLQGSTLLQVRSLVAPPPTMPCCEQMLGRREH